MANKFLLKKSSVASKVPLTTDVDFGELALNYADGKLYYKTSAPAIDYIPSATATATLTNKTLTSPTINGGALSGTFTGAITLSDTTASTSTTTGALKIGGGLGVAGSIYADKIYASNNGNGTNVYIGDDAIIGDVNQANSFSVRGQQDATQGYIIFGSSNNTNYIGRSGTNPITVTGQFSINSGTLTGTSAIALQISGYAGKGGTGYHDFLSVTNSYGSATTPNKYFRLDSSGTLQIINSAYTTNIFNLTDAGVFSVPQISAGGSTGTSGQVLQSTGTGMQWATIAGSGTVTSIVAGTGLTGGTITTTGTIAIDTTVVTTLTGTQTLTNKTLTSPVISTITNTGTITIPTTTGTLALQADTHYIGTTSVALNRASANLALTGISSVTLPGSTSGSVQIIPAAAAGTATVLTLPATTGTVVTTGDTGTVTSTMIADGTIVNADINASAAIAITKLAASTISGVSLGSNLNALTIGTNLTGTSYNGSSAVTIAHAASTVTAGSYGSGTAIPVLTIDAQGHITAASTSAVTIGNSGLTLSIGTAGATNTTVTIGTGTGFTANATSASTYDIKVGPALTALATLMTTAGAGFIKRGATADTYTIDTNTYLTSYTETDTLATVTGRGASTSTNITLSGGTTTLSNATSNTITTGTDVNLFINTRDSSAAATGAVQIRSGSTTFANSTAGLVSIYAGQSTSAAGANVSITGGDVNTATSTGGYVSIRGGTALTGASTAGTGGAVYISGGYAYASAGTKTGGHVYLEGGAPFNAGTNNNGNVYVGTNAGIIGNTGTAAVNIGSSSITTTISGTVKLPTVGTSGFVKLGAGGQLSADTNTYLTSYTETDTLATVTGRGASTSTASTFSGGLTASGGFSHSGGFAYLGNWNSGPSAGHSVPANYSGVAFSWNLSDGSAEANIWNTSNPASYSATGLRFLQWLTASTYRDLMFLRQDGALSFGGTGNIGTAGQVLQSNAGAAPTWVNLPTIGNGTLGVSIGSAGATNTTVTWGTSTGFSANTGSAYTYDLKVGPALTALATLMTTAGAGFIKRGATADTYTIDTNTYLTGNQTITISGDGSGSGATAITLTLANSGVTAGTYSSVTVDAKGRVTSGSNPGYLTGNQTITLSGDVSGSGSTSISTTVNQINGWAFKNTGSNSAVDANTINSNGISYYNSSVDNFSGNSTDGALYSQRYSDSWQHQIAGDYREGNIAVRGKNSGTWSRWKPVPTITISDSAPANETRGDMWWQSSTGKLKIWYADGSSEQWVDAVPIPDTSTFFSKAGGGITGPVVMSSSLTVGGNVSVAGGFTFRQYNTQNLQIYSATNSGAVGIAGHDSAGNWKYQLYGDGSNYGFLNGLWGGWDLRKTVSGNLYINENIALHAGNYTSYSPSLTGSGASGTWGINVTGSAGSVAWGNVSSRPTWMTAGSLIETHSNANDWKNSGFYENGGSGSNWPNGSSTWYNSVNVRHSNQGNYHGFQIAMSYYDNYLYWRSYQGSGTFQTWARGLSDQNYNSYAPTLTGGGASGTWGINITGSAGSISGGGANVYHSNVDTQPAVVMNSDGTYYGHVARRTTQQWGMGWGNGVGNATTFGIYYDTSGNFTATGNVTASSDETLKTNWRNLSENFIENLATTKHGIYDRIDTGTTQVGVSAQSLRKVMPEAVTEDDLTGLLSVTYGHAALVSAVELAKKVVEQEARIARLEALIEKLIGE